MLWLVQTAHLFFFGSPQSHAQVYDLEQDESGSQAPGVGHEQSDYLRD